MNHQFDPNDRIQNMIHMEYGTTEDEIQRKSRQIKRLCYYALYHCKYLPFLIYFVTSVETSQTCLLLSDWDKPINYQNSPSTSEIRRSNPFDVLIGATLKIHLIVDLLSIAVSLILALWLKRDCKAYRGALTFIFYVLIVTQLLPLMFVTIMTVSRGFKICAGDYLTSDELAQPAASKVFLPRRAAFLRVLFYCAWLQIGAITGYLLYLLVTWCISKSRGKQEPLLEKAKSN